MTDLAKMVWDILTTEQRLNERSGMTQERMREIIRTSSFSGYSRNMTPDEIAEVRAEWDRDPDGGSSFASTLRRMAGLRAFPTEND